MFASRQWISHFLFGGLKNKARFLTALIVITLLISLTSLIVSIITLTNLHAFIEKNFAPVLAIRAPG